MPFADALTNRSREDRAEAEIKLMLSKRYEIVDPDDEALQGRIDTLVNKWKGTMPYPDKAARDELYALLKRATDTYYGPAAELEQEMLWSGVEGFLQGRTPNYPGDHIVRQTVKGHRLVEEIELPGIGTRTRVLLSAEALDELQNLQRQLRTAQLSESTARASGKPAAQAMAAREAAEIKLDSWLISHRVSLPSSRPQQEVDLVNDEEGG